jgi:hypothetical protein
MVVRKADLLSRVAAVVDNAAASLSNKTATCRLLRNACVFLNLTCFGLYVLYLTNNRV